MHECIKGRLYYLKKIAALIPWMLRLSGLLKFSAVFPICHAERICCVVFCFTVHLGEGEKVWLLEALEAPPALWRIYPGSWRAPSSHSWMWGGRSWGRCGWYCRLTTIKWGGGAGSARNEYVIRAAQEHTLKCCPLHQGVVGSSYSSPEVVPASLCWRLNCIMV